LGGATSYLGWLGRCDERVVGNRFPLDREVTAEFGTRRGRVAGCWAAVGGGSGGSAEGRCHGVRDW
jgi:hypothetical protein